MRPAVGRPADAVELVEKAREAARLALVLIVFLVCVVARARGEHDARRVGRPRELLDALLAIGELLRLAALCGNDEEVVRRLLVAAVGDEREPASVRRPARRRVASLARREWARLARPVARRHPDCAAVLIPLFLDPPQLVRDACAVRRDTRIRHA